MVRIQQQDFDASALLEELKRASGDCGAIVSFIGLVREFSHEATIQSMTLEHYPGMTEQALEAIRRDAMDRWPLNGAIIVHRVGTLKAGDHIVFVATASNHRKDAFEAAQYIMDFLKTDAPFWKKEHTDKGDQWVDARQSDYDERKRWGNES